MIRHKFFVHERVGIAYLRLWTGKKKCEMSLGYKTTVSALEDALSPKPASKNVPLSRFLASVELKIEQFIFHLVEIDKTDDDVAKLKALLVQSLFGGSQAKTEEEVKQGEFIKHYQKFLETKTNPGTNGVYKHTLDKIRQFDPEIDQKNFEDINLDWLEAFEAHCAKTATKNARNIHLRNIRAVFNHAIDHEVTTAYPFRRFKIRPEETKKRSLSVEELRQLFTMPVEEYQEFYRDMFKLIFMFIGINTVDLHHLQTVERGRINFKRAKTGRLYSIKVEPEAQAVIDKYKGVNGLIEAADRWSDHRNFRHQLNKALQRLGEVERRGRGGKKIIEVAFPGLTSYWARHTWATIAADLDIPDAVISQALGHAGPNTTTNIYIKRNDKKVDEANRKVLDWVLYGRR